MLLSVPCVQLPWHGFFTSYHPLYYLPSSLCYVVITGGSGGGGGTRGRRVALSTTLFLVGSDSLSTIRSSNGVGCIRSLQLKDLYWNAPALQQRSPGTDCSSPSEILNNSTVPCACLCRVSFRHPSFELYICGFTVYDSLLDVSMSSRRRPAPEAFQYFQVIGKNIDA